MHPSFLFWILTIFRFHFTCFNVAYCFRTPVRSSGGALSTRPLGVVQLVSTAVKQNGVMVLWRGTVPSVCRVVPGVTLYFTTLEALQSFVISEQVFFSWISYLCAYESFYLCEPLYSLRFKVFPRVTQSACSNMSDENLLVNRY